MPQFCLAASRTSVELVTTVTGNPRGKYVSRYGNFVCARTGSPNVTGSPRSHAAFNCSVVNRSTDSAGPDCSELGIFTSLSLELVFQRDLEDARVIRLRIDLSERGSEVHDVEWIPEVR